MGKQRIAIFGSGAGTNAQNIIEYFANHPTIKVGLVVSNKPNVGLCEIAIKKNIPLLILSKEEINQSKTLEHLSYFKIDWIILAGFLLLFPKKIIDKYSNKIINIHPALLPKYGGKGMYGKAVHQAVIDGNENESGITIHYVNELFDEGEIIFQAKCAVESGENAESLANKVQKLEHKYFPAIIEKSVLG